MNSYLQHGLNWSQLRSAEISNRYALDHRGGIGAFVQEHPQIRYLFGSASISARYGHEATARMPISTKLM